MFKGDPLIRPHDIRVCGEKFLHILASRKQRNDVFIVSVHVTALGALVVLSARRARGTAFGREKRAVGIKLARLVVFRQIVIEADDIKLRKNALKPRMIVRGGDRARAVEFLHNCL